MTAFILERLYSNGWRRYGDLYWRLVDAEAIGRKEVSACRVRAIRVLPVEIGTESVLDIDREPNEQKELAHVG